MDYKNGKIYAIRSHQCEEIYIGSTCSPLAKRLYEHRKQFKKYQNGKGNYVTSYEILKYDDHYIELIKLYPCDKRCELHREEGEHIRALDCVNKLVAGRTKKEYREDNKEQYKQYQNQYYQDNKQARLLQMKKYHQENKEAVLLQHKQYRQDNKDKIKQYKKQYYQKIKLQKKQKYTCVCGSTLRIDSKSRHEKTKKHIKFITKD